MLLRAELASHVVHSLPLDVCGADTQGATGYMLQQAIRNWLGDHQTVKDAVSIVTQVIVDPIESSPDRLERGIGPYFDQEKAQTYRNARGWNFVLIPGRGYRRAVPALTPRGVPEIPLIRRLLDPAAIIMCAGGGGIPVVRDQAGHLSGVEGVVNKADTASLLGRELHADGIVFLSVWDRLKHLPGFQPIGSLASLGFDQLQAILAGAPGADEDGYRKLRAARQFLQEGGKWVCFCPPEGIGANLEFSQGVMLQEHPADKAAAS
ncbi:MAG TPA: hypothetical protein VF813_01610, partial [Anaerolineaceae bacterium]